LIKIVKKFIYHLTNKKSVYLVDSDNDLDFITYNIKKEKLLGIDTEFSWRSTYFPILSLLQIATKNKIFLIDCLKCKKLIILKKILEDKDKLIIFHSSRNDTTALYTNLKIKVENVFDIQIAEKNITGGDIKNYGSIIKKYFDINLKKTETNSNWLKRPFSKDQLSYAAEDVSFLIETHKKQVKILKRLNLLKLTIKESKKESNLGNQDLHISRIKKLNKMTKFEKEIFYWREKYAEKNNIPPSFICSDKNLKILLKRIKNKTFNKEFCNEIFNKPNTVDDFFRDMKI
jgi:ribonuclease D|tara:strand:- start:1349 stop:2212 length:864 start_codon:yes stop_codon:yes gene_type:complete